MECFKIENLTFAYAGSDKNVLENIDFSVKEGEFVTICGKSGCGKTTLLRLLKPSIAPFGEKEGSIKFFGEETEKLCLKSEAEKIGFVMQDAENQAVTDKVWHELAFGLESLGYENSEIRARVSEMASFFGIHTWFHKNVSELSGGQKQLLNLASVMVLQPSALILDEPVSQLDPIAGGEFLKTLEKINKELGTTVIIAEHNLEEVFNLSDRVIFMENGKIAADADPRSMGEFLVESGNDMYDALPVPVRVHGSVKNSLKCPLNVREGRRWLEEYSKENSVNGDLIPAGEKYCGNDTVIELKDIWFRYGKNLPDIVKALSLEIKKGEIFAIVGGNGAGKTTALSLMGGLNIPYRGKILIDGEDIRKYDPLVSGKLAVLPQNPKSLFVRKTVFLDLMDMLDEKDAAKAEKESRIKEAAALCRIGGLLERHPYDLSGGEQQRAALAKLLLKDPEILLLDEPTKGIDAHFKHIFAQILCELREKGKTIVMVSHDIEFCAEYADRCGMFFDGAIVSEGEAREFFAGKSFYTTAANRMARNILPKAVLAEDIIAACGGSTEKRNGNGGVKFEEIHFAKEEKKAENTAVSAKRKAMGCLFALAVILTGVFGKYSGALGYGTKLIMVLETAAALYMFFPKKEREGMDIRKPKGGLNGKSLMWAVGLTAAVIFTVYFGMAYLDNRKYYFISLLIILESLGLFFMKFENRKPKARELVIISVLCAIAVAGRTAFFMLPQFKPVAAVVIIAGVCFGGETGFLVGAVTAFVSNFFFGQGPWTPWQMFSFGALGLMAGIIFESGLIKASKIRLCIFGGLAVFFIYGGIMNAASVLMWQRKPTAEMFITAYAMGVPFDLIHAASTMFFMWFISEAMVEKLERVKIKYGMM